MVLALDKYVAADTQKLKAKASTTKWVQYITNTIIKHF